MPSPDTLVLLATLVALVVAHEGGHAAAASALRLRWQPFLRMPWKAGIRVYGPTPRQSRIIALAGPGVNLALVPLVLLPHPWATAGWYSLAIATAPSALDWVMAARRHRHQPVTS